MELEGGMAAVGEEEEEEEAAAAKRARPSQEVDGECQSDGVPEAPSAEHGKPADGVSSVIPGWFSEISPLWPGLSALFFLIPLGVGAVWILRPNPLL